MSPQMLNYSEGIFHLGPNPGDCVSFETRTGDDCGTRGPRAHNRSRLSSLAFVRLLGIRAVAKQRLFVAMLEPLQHLPVMHLGFGNFSRMNNRLPLCLYAYMPFRTEMPSVVLARRTHLRVSCFANVLLTHWCR